MKRGALVCALLTALSTAALAVPTIPAGHPSDRELRAFIATLPSAGLCASALKRWDARDANDFSKRTLDDQAVSWRQLY